MVSCVTCFHLTSSVFFLFFFFNDTATTEIYTLSLHDALPTSLGGGEVLPPWPSPAGNAAVRSGEPRSVRDRKSTRLNSSHQIISYAVFCLKKKKKKIHTILLKEENNKDNNTR